MAVDVKTKRVIVISIRSLRTGIVGCAVIAIGFFAAPALAAPYGSGSYSGCQYQSGCPTPPPSDPGTSNPSGESNGNNPQTYTPPPVVNNPHFDIVPANIKDGDVITSSPVTIEISVEDLTGGNVNPNDVGWVSLYVNNKLITTDYSTNSRGLYELLWDVLKNPGTLLTIVAYNQDGDAIARKDIHVVLDLENAVINTGPQPIDDQNAGWLQKTLHDIPPVVAYTFPYWLFLLLLGLAIRFMYQTAREAIANERMRKLYKRQELIAQEKDNFIALGSHYLHTPLTVMRNGADTVVAVNEAPETVTAPLLAALDELKTRIDAILGKVESNESLRNIKQPDPIQLGGSVLRTPIFWIPVASVGFIVVFMNTLLSLVGKWNFSLTNFSVQAIVGVIVIAFLFATIRNSRIHSHEKAKLKQLVDYQAAIDNARTTLIEESTTVLRDSLAKVETAKAALPATPTAAYVTEGYNRFAEILSRFDLLGQLRAGTSYGAAQKFDLQDTVNTILADYQPTIDAKKLTVHANMHGIKTVGNPALFNYVLRTVVDNAVKFTNEGGEISLEASKKSGKVDVHIVDNGIGIPEDKLPTLFKPFSRAGSAIQFDYEGLGFSLFLDRIIMDYLEGDIDVTSREQQGTLVTIRT